MTPEQTAARAAIDAFKAGMRALADAAALALDAVRAFMATWRAAEEEMLARLRENRARSLASRAAREAAWRAEWAALTPDQRRARAARSLTAAAAAADALRALVRRPAPEPTS